MEKKGRKYDCSSEMLLVLVQVRKCLAWLLIRALVGRGCGKKELVLVPKSMGKDGKR